MRPSHDVEESLAHDIAYAVSRSNLRPKMPVATEPCLAAAKTIVTYLKLANWIFRGRKPAEPHSTHLSRAQSSLNPDADEDEG
jgi:hypothetical protein